LKRFFHDISWVQILAGALAAVTAFLLSSRIGIAGSVIGVAVGSIVSAFASQLYQNVLDESSKKLHDTVGSSDDSADAGTTANDSTDQDNQETRTIVGLAGAINEMESGEATATLAVPTPVQSDATTVMDPAETRIATGDSTSVLSQGNGGAALEGALAQTSVYGLAAPMGAETKVSDASSKIQGAQEAGKHRADKHKTAESAQRHKVKRNVIIVSILSALLAVGITAGIIYAVTDGQGTDRVLTPSETPSSVESSTSDGSSQSPTTSGSSEESDSSNNESQSSGTSTQESTSSSSPSSSSSSSSTSSSSSSSEPTSSSSTSSSSPSPSESTSSSSPSSSSSSSTSGSNSNAAATQKSSASPSDGSDEAAE
jgi:hypothetical protein